MRFLLIMTLTILACNPGTHRDDLLTIDLVKNIHNIKDIPLSSIADNIEYIPLKTEGAGLLGDIHGILELNDTLIIYGYDFCKTYDKFGNYLNDIGRKGNGPGEYASVGLVSIDRVKNLIYLSPNHNIQVYNLKGKYIKSLPIPEIADYNATIINGSVFCSIMNIRTGKEKVRMYYFDDRGTLIDSTLNRLSYLKSVSFYSSAERGLLIPANDYFLFKDGVNDTIYRVDSTLKSVPYFRIDLGKFKMPYEVLNNTLPDFSKISLNYISIFDLLESDSNIFLEFGFKNHYPFNQIRQNTVKVFGANVKVDNTLVAAIYDKRKSTLTLLNGENGFGFVNDIDGGPPFWPNYIEPVSGDLYSWVNAFDFYDYMKNQDDIETKNKEANNNLRKLMENMDASGNPIVIKVSSIKPG